MANILLIDDDHALQTMYTTVLESAGHKVTIANNGEEGLILINQYPIDLILLDVDMPVMDGFEFLETYDRKKHSAKIIILTNSNDVELINRAIALGANNYIDKANVTPAAMGQIVDGVLSN